MVYMVRKINIRTLLTIITLLLSVTTFSQTKEFNIVKENGESVAYKLSISKQNFGAPKLVGIDLNIEGEYYLTKISNELWYIMGNSRYVVKIDYKYKNITITINGKLIYNLMYSSYKQKKK